jgi:hypothetical protein
MKEKRISLLIICLCIASAIGAAAVGLSWLNQRAQETQDLSKMAYLKSALAPELETFYQKHGEFPHSLQDLPLEFRWGDGSTPKDLQLFSYTSAGQTFVMFWQGRHYKVFLSGDHGKLKYSENEGQ